MVNLGMEVFLYVIGVGIERFAAGSSSRSHVKRIVVAPGPISQGEKAGAHFPLRV